ncbi:CPBP family intramembrane glutamic endopeptidase [Bdellovibrio bacteriovorus]|uniref:CPBP family intramembrane glutamic endopeptidase n=1 Tax=Bdellovibrio bacteriovorus TaxID=959 RepID=UPI0035A72D2B
MMMKTSIKKYAAITAIILYWLWLIYKCIHFPNRKPESIQLAVVYSIAEGLLVTVIVGGLLFLEKLSFLQLLKKDFNRSAILHGLKWALISFIGLNFVISPLSQIISSVFQLQMPPADENIRYLFKDSLAPVYWILISLIGGGFAEEVIRIFSLVSFEKAFGRKGLYVALIISSTLFGLGHIYQGPSGVIMNFFAGLFWGLLFVKRRNVITNIVTHGVYDLIGSLIACYLYK